MKHSEEKWAESWDQGTQFSILSFPSLCSIEFVPELEVAKLFTCFILNYVTLVLYRLFGDVYDNKQFKSCILLSLIIAFVI